MEAQTAHLINAGLNPALMYAKGGTGGSTGSGSSSVGGGQASNAAAMQQANTAQAMSGMAMMKLQSEVDLNKATAEKLRAEVPKIGADTGLTQANIQKVTEEIKNISADTALKGEQTKLNELQQLSTKIANEFNVEQNQQILKQTFEQIRLLNANANVAQQTQGSLVKIAQENVNMVLSNITLNNSKISLNEMQKSVMRMEILNIANSIKISNGKLAVDQGMLQNAINTLEQNKDLKIRELHSGSILNQIRGVSNLIGAVFGEHMDYSK